MAPNPRLKRAAVASRSVPSPFPNVPRRPTASPDVQRAEHNRAFGERGNFEKGGTPAERAEGPSHSSKPLVNYRHRPRRTTT